MDFTGKTLRNTYLKYLGSTFGLAFICSIYAIVDMAMVGRYEGPAGTAALAVIAPVWNIVYALGLLTGIGGSVLFSELRGRGRKEDGSRYFTAAAVYVLLLSAAVWALIFFAETPLLRFFGADDAILPLAKTYLAPIRFVLPFYMINQMLGSFLRNDGAPVHATLAILAGGVFNMFGDYFFVFTLDMGIFGAGLATALGSVIGFALLVPHFFSKKNTLKFVRIPLRRLHGEKGESLPAMLGKITAIGFSSFFNDIAMGIVTVFFNRQIMRYLDTDALAVYAVIINVSTFVQCSAYSVGQACQPLFSFFTGSGQKKETRRLLRYALISVAAFGVFWTALVCACPGPCMHFFLGAEADAIASAPAILRAYALSFLLLPLNIFTGYYLQSLMMPVPSFVLSVARGLVISGLLIILLPAVFGSASLWFAMPLTEAVVAAASIVLLKRRTPAVSG